MNSSLLRLIAIVILTLTPPSSRAVAQATLGEELTLRLLSGLDPQDSTLTLMPGGVPTDGRLALALSESERLVGSLVRRDPAGAIIELETVIDSLHPARQATTSFHRALLAAGWREWLSPQPVGFAPDPVLYTAMYCAQTDSSFLYLSAFQSTSPQTDVRLKFFADTGYSPCLEPEPLGAAEPPSIPILLPPTDSEIVNFGSQQALIDQLSTSALVTTDLTQAELFRHFEVQLEAAGWQRETRGETGARDYSRWILSDAREQVWTSLLSVVEIVEEPGRYFVAVVVLIPAAADAAASD